MPDKYALEPGARALLTDIGISTAAVMRRAGLRADLLSGGPVWLTQDEFFSLWRALEVEVNEPNLPLLIAQAFSPEVFAPSVFAAMMSPDLNTAAQRVAFYKRLIGPVRMNVDIDERRTMISFDWPDGAEPPATLALTELLAWVAVVRAGTRAHVVPSRIAVNELPEDLASYRTLLRVDFEVSETSSISFSGADASRPFLTANEAIWATFEPQLRRQLADLDVEAPTSERVRATLLECLPVGRTTVAEVANELAVSSRTLHRQLKAEQASFQQILDATREELARHYLRDPDLSAAEIAFLLGYGETSSFYRAFRNWTGGTPEHARAALVSS